MVPKTWPTEVLVSKLVPFIFWTVVVGFLLYAARGGRTHMRVNLLTLLGAAATLASSLSGRSVEELPTYQS